MKLFLITSCALIAFAANSVLCRIALGDEVIDATSFTSIRLASGALTLMIILGLSKHKMTNSNKGSWRASFFLFVYAAGFSYAYLSLDTGTGALILFGAVQITIMLVSFMTGERFNKVEWLGLLIAFSGFVYLITPNLTTPSFIGFISMMIAGIAWGAYTICGKQSSSPLFDTAFNFLRSLPLVILLIAITYPSIEINANGILLAVLSGSIASGIGYTLWYTSLPYISSIHAASLQLLVPVLAAFGGIVLANELIEIRLITSSVLVLGGIALVIFGKKMYSKKS